MEHKPTKAKGEDERELTKESYATDVEEDADADDANTCDTVDVTTIASQESDSDSLKLGCQKMYRFTGLPGALACASFNCLSKTVNTKLPL